MKQLEEFALDDSPVNQAVELVMAQLRTATDKGGIALCEDIDWGNHSLPADLPAIRVFDKIGFDIRSQQHHTQNYLVELRLLFYFHLPPEGTSKKKFHALRNNYIQQVMRSVEAPDADNPGGFEPDLSWWDFENPQTMNQDDDELARRERERFDTPENIHVTSLTLRLSTKYKKP